MLYTIKRRKVHEGEQRNQQVYSTPLLTASLYIFGHRYQPSSIVGNLLVRSGYQGFASVFCWWCSNLRWAAGGPADGSKGIVEEVKPLEFRCLRPKPRHRCLEPFHIKYFSLLMRVASTSTPWKSSHTFRHVKRSSGGLDRRTILSTPSTRS